MGENENYYNYYKLFFAETVGPFGTKAHIKKFKGEWE